MKVAVIIDTWFPAVGGGQVNVWETSKRLASKDLEIDIITRNMGNDKLPEIKYLNIYKLGDISRPDNSVSKILFSIKAFFFIVNKNYNLIHAHPFLPILFAKLASMTKRIPIVITVHGTRLFEKKPLITPSIILEWIILTRIKYDLMISVTEAFKKIKNVNKNIIVVPNGIDLKNFNRIRAKKTSYPKILWVGRFDQVKQVDKLIMAMPRVLERVSNAMLFLVGYGYEKENLKKLTKRLKIEKHVVFAGKKTGDDLIREYKSSHVFVLPSSSEGQPLTILEALICRVPIIANNVGDIPAYVINKKNGLIIDSLDSSKIAVAIISVIGSPNMINLESKKNILTWEESSKFLLKSYNEILKL